MNLNIANRRALVLGASGGLGAAIAAGLLAEGATVYGATRNPASLANGKLHAVKMDLGIPGDAERAAGEVLAQGPIDILVNNCGGPPPAAAGSVESALWMEQFQKMAVSLFALTRAVLPGMLQQSWGRVLTIASSGVEQPIPNLAISNAVRASVVGWSKTLANEVASQGVTVNVLIPGRIHTDRVDSLDRAAASKQGKTPAEIAAASAASIPAGRYGTPQEFADMAVFLASDRAAYVTGSLIRVDGGLVRSI